MEILSSLWSSTNRPPALKTVNARSSRVPASRTGARPQRKNPRRPRLIESQPANRKKARAVADKLRGSAARRDETRRSAARRGEARRGAHRRFLSTIVSRSPVDASSSSSSSFFRGGVVVVSTVRTRAYRRDPLSQYVYAHIRTRVKNGRVPSWRARGSRYRDNRRRRRRGRRGARGLARGGARNVSR